MKLRICSDIHWEFDTKHIDNMYWQPTVMPDDGDTILVIAGDMYYGNMSAAVIAMFNNRFKHIIVILGNHDYWNLNIPYHNVAQSLRDTFKELNCANVTVLDNSTLDVDGYLFVGGTLWTNMDDHNPKTIHDAPFVMYPDFEYIMVDHALTEHYGTIKTKMTPQFWLNEHQITLSYINHIINLNKDRKVIIISHHLPSMLSCDKKYDGNPSNHYFASEYKYSIEQYENVPLWIHGHSHSPADYMLGNTRVIANPRGYPRENPLFDEGLVVELYENGRIDRHGKNAG